MNTPKPGKYIRTDGEEFDVIGIAKDVSTGARTVVYTDARGEMFTCPVTKWKGYASLADVRTEEYIPMPEPPPPDVTYSAAAAAVSATTRSATGRRRS